LDYDSLCSSQPTHHLRKGLFRIIRFLQMIHNYFYGEPIRDKSCSFCLTSYKTVGPLIEGCTGAHICGNCLRFIESQIAEHSHAPNKLEGDGSFDSSATEQLQSNTSSSETHADEECSSFACSFCCQNQTGQVSISPDNKYVICNQCVAFSIDLLKNAAQSHRPTK